MTVNDYCSEFERNLRLKNNAQSTIDTYVGIVRQWLLYTYKDPKVITVRMIEDYLLTLKCTSYKRQTIYTLQNFYRSVLKLPDYLKDITIPKQEKFIPEILSIQEVHRLISSISNLKQRSCIQIIYSCGLRISEAVNLKVKDIDGDRLQIHIKQSKGAKDRIVPLPHDTLTLLREYYKEYKPKDFLFEGQNNPSYDQRSIQQVFYRAKEKAGIIKKVTVHSLRHSRATHLVDSGVVDMSLIQKFLGHSNIKTTVDFYLHTSISTMQNLFQIADTNMKHILNPSITVQNDIRKINSRN